ncbi:MAG: 50S ribosomal protein L22 [Pyrinomonadaceae bacterium]|nr:50S ribosomal protein L22 [Pyrinomonadaceae bacterium]
MEAVAKTKYLKGSPQKTRLVIDLVRGENVSKALAILQYTNKRAAGPIAKCIRSAIANATYAAEQQNIAIDPDELWVKTCYVDMGPTKNRRRLRPAPQGRAFQERRHYCHITVMLSSEEQEEPVDEKPKSKGKKLKGKKLQAKEAGGPKKEKKAPVKKKAEAPKEKESEAKEEKTSKPAESEVKKEAPKAETKTAAKDADKEVKSETPKVEGEKKAEKPEKPAEAKSEDAEAEKPAAAKPDVKKTDKKEAEDAEESSGDKSDK